MNDPDKHVLLHTLSPDHPLRNVALGTLQAQCRNVIAGQWRGLDRWFIAQCTYNDLSGTWIEHNEFQVSVRCVDGR